MDRAQTYVERVPWPALAALVRTVWVQRTGPRPYLQRNLPTGGVELQCQIGAMPRLAGPLTAASVQVLPAYTTVVGARFQPGAASPLLGLPADELVDLTVRLDYLWGGTAARLGELLAAAPGPDAALGLLQRYLVCRQARTDRPDPLVAEAVRRLMPWQPVEIGALAAQLAISASQLRRRFAAAVGVGPKSVQRTLRFQGFLALAQAAPASGGPGLMPGSTLADLAAEVGYADHAHLSRECLCLTGLTPRELLGSRSERCGCGHEHSASYLPFLLGYTRGARAG
jgi:AraC-like DNA-binding protein